MSNSSSTTTKTHPVQGTTEPQDLILVVDDESSILTLTVSALKRNGYPALASRSGAEAMATYAAQGDRIKVVITDLIMPMMDGVALSRSLLELNPELKIIASTGQPDTARDAQLVSMGIKEFLVKPYDLHSLLATVARVMN